MFKGTKEVELIFKQTLSAVALATTLMTGAAGAATLSIDDGVAGTVPGGVPGSNEALAQLGLPDSLGGFYGAAIRLIGAGKVTFTLLGSEAGNQNTFALGVDSLVDAAGGNSFSKTGFGAFMQTLTAGIIDFSFTTNGSQTVLNGANPNNTDPVPTPGINFFASIIGNPDSRTGSSLYLFFDDDGANNDDNHDDLVVRVDVAPVPLPAAGIMLMAGLGGLAALRQRRRAA